MCLYPKYIKNKKYTANKKNGGIIPAIPDMRHKEIPIGCRNCIECRKQKAREWQVRLSEEIKENKNGKFITLTFNNEQYTKLYNEIKNLDGYNRDNAIAKIAIRRFLERHRKETKKSIRHWLVTELGHKGTENIHIHGIIWTDKTLTEIETIWQYGYMWKGKEIINTKNKIKTEIQNYVNQTTIGYITKYITKIDVQHKHYKAKIFTSPGIGKNYINTNTAKQNTFNNENTKEYYKTSTGHKITLPTYYRKKIYTEEQREKLWTNKLNQNKIYIAGRTLNKITEQHIYNNILKYQRQKNIELGYNDDKPNMEEQMIERQKRNEKQKQRFVLAEKYTTPPRPGKPPHPGKTARPGQPARPGQQTLKTGRK